MQTVGQTELDSTRAELALRLKYNQVLADHNDEPIVVTLSTHAVGRFAERCSRDIEYHDRVRELRHLWEHAVIVEDRPTWIGRLVGPASDEAAAESPALYALIADIVFPLILNDDDRGWVATTCLMKLGARGNHRASANYQRRPARAQKASRRKYRERGPELGRRGMRWALDDE